MSSMSSRNDSVHKVKKDQLYPSIPISIEGPNEVTPQMWCEKAEKLLSVEVPYLHKRMNKLTKTKKIFRIATGILGCSSVVFGTVAVGTVATVVGIPVAIAFGAAGAISGTLAVTVKAAEVNTDKRLKTVTKRYTERKLIIDMLREISLDGLVTRDEIVDLSFLMNITKVTEKDKKIKTKDLIKQMEKHLNS